jgi:hypothetical protein
MFIRVFSAVAFVCLFSATAFTQVPPPVDALELAVDQHAANVAPGAPRVAPFTRGFNKQDWTVQLNQGACYTLAGASSAGVRRTSIYVWGPDGRRVTEVKPYGNYAHVSVCPQWTGLYHIQAKLEGNGAFAVGLYAGGSAAPPPQPVAAPAWPSVTVQIGAPPAYAAPPAYGPPQECRMGSDGMNVCGYNCRMGSNGHMYCSDVPNGRCALNSDGTFTCPRANQFGAVYDKPQECRMGSDGQNVCGYNCRMGSDGHFYCASMPNGRCALNSDGSYTCP